MTESELNSSAHIYQSASKNNQIPGENQFIEEEEKEPFE